MRDNIDLILITTAQLKLQLSYESNCQYNYELKSSNLQQKFLKKLDKSCGKIESIHQ